MRVLGVDPGLTRCGIGIVDTSTPKSQMKFIAVGVIKSSPDLPLEQRLLEIDRGLRSWIDDHQPDVIAVERVFSQHNVRTVMGTAQVAGIALVAAAQYGIKVAMHTPSEVKAAVTGSGRAKKGQVGDMVQRILNLKEIPKPADAADALALAIFHIWRGSADSKLATAVAKEKNRLAKLRASA